jgi:phosphoribosylanthranilate isomerase
VLSQAGTADALLIDSGTQQASGGTGIAFDWSAAGNALSGLTLPLIVAGGLRPENVGAAVATLRPWGVDVSGGVEQSPGVKDREKVRQFIQNARAA